MQVTKIEIVEGDAAFDLNFTLQDYNGNAINLTDCTLVLKVQKEHDTSLKFSGSMSIVSAVAGTCKYTVQSGNFDSPGKYDAEIEITNGSQTITYSNIKIFVSPQLPKTN